MLMIFKIAFGALLFSIQAAILMVFVMIIKFAWTLL